MRAPIALVHAWRAHRMTPNPSIEGDSLPATLSSCASCRTLGDVSVSTEDFLKFVPIPIDAVGIRTSDGPNVRIAFAVIQRTTALRAYNSFGKGRDWMEELSTAYIVALATRSADTLLMKLIQGDLAAKLSTSCSRCKEATIGQNVIRERLFPT